MTMQEHLGSRQDGADDVIWHGWRLQGDPAGYSVHVGNLPGRKKVALYAEDDDSFQVLAYFQSDEAAKEYAEWMDRLQESINEH